MDKDVNIVIVDDHQLVRKGFVELINNLKGFNVLFDVNNGRELINKLDKTFLPDLVVLDIDMPEMDGFETAAYLSDHFPQIKIIVISVFNDPKSIRRMIDAGADGYILKDATPTELELALNDIVEKGMYPSVLVQNALISSRNILGEKTINWKVELNDNQLTFIKLSCTSLTYSEIAHKMFKAKSTVDGYREVLFERFDIKSRVGLVIFALKNKIVTLSQLEEEYKDLFSKMQN